MSSMKLSSSWADDEEDDTPFEEINFDNSQDGVHFFFKKHFSVTEKKKEDVATIKEETEAEVAEPQKRAFAEIFDKKSGDANKNSDDKTVEDNNDSKPKSKRARLDSDKAGKQKGESSPLPFQPIEDLTPAKVAKRQKQIDLGKSTEGYKNYCKQIPRHARRKFHPRTPDKYRRVSKRTFSNWVSKWRRALHKFDDIPAPKAPSGRFNLAGSIADFATVRNPPSVPSNDKVAHTPPTRQNSLDLGSSKEFPLLDDSTETPKPPIRLPMQRTLSFKAIIDKAKTSPPPSPNSVKRSVSAPPSPRKVISPRSKESSKISYASVASAATVKAL